MKKKSAYTRTLEIIAMIFALLLGSLYLVAIQFSIEALLDSVFRAETFIWGFFLTLFSIMFIGILFIVYYAARYMEEEYVTNAGLKFSFDYVIPILFYLLFSILLNIKTIALSIIVIALALLVRWLMERLFWKMYKKTKQK